MQSTTIQLLSDTSVCTLIHDASLLYYGIRMYSTIMQDITVLLGRGTAVLLGRGTAILFHGDGFNVMRDTTVL
jgi:hypothetical protein